MIVTSLSALAVSVRSTLTWGGSSPDPGAPAAAPSTRAPARPTDTVELSKDRALELLKRASVRFHHLPRTSKSHGIEKRDDRWTSRLEDVFAHVDRNHDGAIDVSELTSALPKAVQRPESRQSCSPTQDATGAPTSTATVVTSVTVAAVALRAYTASDGTPSVPQSQRLISRRRPL